MLPPPAVESHSAPACATTMTKSAPARASGSTRLIASAPLPNASPWMFRAAVLVGVSVVVMPMTAIFTPFFVTSFQGVAQSGRAVPAVFVMFADRKGYFASRIRAWSVSSDQSNSRLPIAARVLPNTFRGADALRCHRVDRPAPMVGFRQRGALHLVAGIEPHPRGDRQSRVRLVDRH